MGKPWAVVATAFLLVTSCNSKQLEQVQLDTARLQDQVAALERTQARLSGVVDSLSTLVEEQTREVRNRRASSQDRLSEVERLLQALQAELDAANAEISELKDRLRYEQGIGPGAALAAGAAVGAAAGSAAATGDTAPQTQVTPRSLYDAAYQDLTRGNHGLALMGFEEVLSQFPESELADNAQYWIGETYYDQGNYEQALSEFRKVPEQFSTGDKVPAALLKTGFCLQQVGRNSDACEVFEDLIRRFPGSEEARLAQTKRSDNC
jgi:tol-pal system protein YbgF